MRVCSKLCFLLKNVEVCSGCQEIYSTNLTLFDFKLSLDKARIALNLVIE